MKLPNGDRAIIPMEKLIGYCLNPHHAKGKHKARVFQSVLNLTVTNADIYPTGRVAGAVVQQDATPQERIFKVDWEIPDTNGRQLRTTWKIAHTSEIPRLITAFIKRSP